jgi:hypothetical protein
MRSALIVMLAVGLIGGVFYLTSAGSLTPSAAPAGTMRALSSVYDSVASAGFDSSAISADPHGSAFQIAKCIAARMTGGTCP